jgi:small-conductance mechanosensitive channel
VEPDPVPDVLLMAYADAGVALRLRWWIKPPRRSDALAIQDQVLEKVKAALTMHGIDLPYPTHQVLFHDQTEETDGDRRRQREGWPAGQDEVPRPARCVGDETARDRPRSGD